MDKVAIRTTIAAVSTNTSEDTWMLTAAAPLAGANGSITSFFCPCFNYAIATSKSSAAGTLSLNVEWKFDI